VTSRPSTDADPPGLPLDRVRAWLDHVVPGGCGRLTADVIPGGRSNLTFRVTDGDRTWVVRRPPLGEHLATAHDVAREHRILAALADTDVPVPRTWGLCEEPDVIGAPFYVMEHVAGTTYRTRDDLAGLGPARVRALSERLVDVLVDIHAVPVEEVGLADWGRPEGYLERQVRRWYRQLEGASTPHLDLARVLHDRLLDALPPSRHVGLVHGDLRLDNVLVDADDQLLAVIDWELSTVGDTMADLALMVGYRRLAEQVRSDVVPNASIAEGHLDEAGLLERYAAASGRPLADTDFHLALAFFKIAGIVAGIDDRHRRGQLTGAGVDLVGETVAPLLRSGIELL
jgi:aminoglycoside phosphotransferase (APT) family kinase protein